MVAVLLPGCRTRVHRPRPRSAACRHRRVQQPTAADRADRAPAPARDALRRAPPRTGGSLDMTSLVEEPQVTRTREATLLELRQLVVDYGVGAKRARAVDGVDLGIHEGEIVGLAGESGCGQTTIANAVMQILRPPARIAGGSILFEGENLVG